MKNAGLNQIVFTLTARCRDCYRCVRACPVKAIRMHHGQAYVDQERCIACGTCIRECPQQAKTFRSDVEFVQQMIVSGAKVAASLAPSFASEFNEWQRERLASALRRLGFSYVGQTSQGAYQVAHATYKCVKDKYGPCVATACPALVNYVQKYQPHLIDYLVPVASPMVVHCRMLKDKLGEGVKTVFIGPCVAKKSEAQWPQNSNAVDAALTFIELKDWLKSSGIDLTSCEESRFDEPPAENANYFPLPGGLLKTAGIDDDGLQVEVVQVSGPQQVKQILEAVPKSGRYLLIEPLFCSQGCINGPGMDTQDNVFKRRQELLEYCRKHCREKTPLVEDGRLLNASFEKTGDFCVPVREEQIQAVFEQTGKSDPAQQLNCGACGYNSCREKAIAVIQGMAEAEMCIPYMRRLAERKTDRIIETSPNGIVILDHDLGILSMNKSFKQFFGCSDTSVGRHISFVMDPVSFEKVASGVEECLAETVEFPQRYFSCHQLIYALRQERQYVGIFVDVSHIRGSERRLRQIKNQTVQQAKELLEHQIGIAQNIARFLGESTAKGEELVNKLMMIMNEDDKDKSGQP
ncbi:MAG: [Fe-Fe] hydrogenase large subunit C-terminal domain-containing protein [Candidatus Omnitrophica bacterium]|nr:[Fe-Fe] hydrogenase large subunit C-terminal domain-containing protein [Candidatus Omnitrophota bacterium]MDD5500907.1 [Fe-Fe] hydrogenase large subunit C-terminal domain-containing protein [Candidatus Omnitrophota bacterium]